MPKYRKPKGIINITLNTYKCSGCGEIRVLLKPHSKESSRSSSEYKGSNNEDGNDSNAGLKITEFVKSKYRTPDM